MTKILSDILAILLPVSVISVLARFLPGKRFEKQIKTVLALVLLAGMSAPLLNLPGNLADLADVPGQGSMDPISGDPLAGYLTAFRQTLEKGLRERIEAKFPNTRVTGVSAEIDDSNPENLQINRVCLEISGAGNRDAVQKYVSELLAGIEVRIRWK